MFGLTMSLALETASKGITVNTATPGYISTEMTAAVPASVMEKLVERIPVGRLGEPNEVARVVEFLADRNRDTSPARSTPSTAASTCRRSWAWSWPGDSLRPVTARPGKKDG